MRYAWWALCFVLVGCSTGGGSSSGNNGSGGTQGSQQAAIEQGQWEFQFPPDGSSGESALPPFMEANIQVTGTQFSASGTALTGYLPYFNQPVWYTGATNFPSGYVIQMCESPITLSGSAAPNLSITVTNGQSDTGNLTATISGSNVTSFSGQWTALVGGHLPWQCQGDAVASGEFTATAIAALNGNFAGTLQTSPSGTDQILITVSQSGYTVSASGSASGAALSISQATVVGAVIYGNGTTTNDTFRFGGHIRPDGLSVDIVILDGNGTVEYGTLTHQ